MARQRLTVSLTLGIIAAFVSMINSMSTRRRDFGVMWESARALVHGETLPGLFYPLPSVIATMPFALVPTASLANGLFMLLGASAFAWALLAHGRGALIGFASAGMYVAAVWVQWSPLFAGAYAVAPLGVFLIVKPHTGFPIWFARPSWWTLASGAVCALIAFLVDPAWLEHWRASFALSGGAIRAGPTGIPYTAPVLLPGGVLVLLALSRWRRPEARLLVALACVPQSLLLYETVPLALVPRGWKEATIFTALSYAVLLLVPTPTGRAFAPFAMASGRLSTLLIYVPLTMMVLRRPNEGTLPIWLDQWVAPWPTWLKGRHEASDSAGENQ
jgi:hypothetical protein